ncbi:MAG: sulfatase [Candidatus Aminicenantales bacterium]
MKSRNNILLIIVDCLRADFVQNSEKLLLQTITRLKKNGFYLLSAISSTSTTSPSFSSILTGLYPYETGVRTLAGFSLREDVVTLPQVLKESGYHTYAEVTGPLVAEIGLCRGFERYHYRSRRRTIHTDWGRELVRKFKNFYKPPWFVLLHIWPLHDQKTYYEGLYTRELGRIDRYLSNLFSSLDEKTVIILTSDHGEEIEKRVIALTWKRAGRTIYKAAKKRGLIKTHYGKGLRKLRLDLGHGHGLYEPQVRIPLIFFHPSFLAPGCSTYQVRQIDIFPTIVDLAGIDCKMEVTGKSLLPIMEGRDKRHRDAYLEATGRIIARKNEWVAGLRVDNKFKYIYSPFREDYEEELYDLEQDPEERENIAPKKRELALRLRRRIERMKTEAMRGKEMDREEQKKLVKKLRDLGYTD